MVRVTHYQSRCWNLEPGAKCTPVRTRSIPSGLPSFAEPRGATQVERNTGGQPVVCHLLLTVRADS